MAGTSALRRLDSPPVIDQEQMARSLRRLAHEIVEAHPRAEDVIIVGVHTRGVPLAHRLAETVAELSGFGPPVGELDTTPHRDDGARRRSHRQRHRTVMPEGVEGRVVILVDDVLFTGRTARAAMDALTELGRPSKVELAVLVDRGHRELPIRADYVAKNLPTAESETVAVRCRPVDPADGVWIVEDRP